MSPEKRIDNERETCSRLQAVAAQLEVPIATTLETEKSTSRSLVTTATGLLQPDILASPFEVGVFFFVSFFFRLKFERLLLKLYC